MSDTKADTDTVTERDLLAKAFALAIEVGVASGDSIDSIARSLADHVADALGEDK